MAQRLRLDAQLAERPRRSAQAPTKPTESRGGGVEGLGGRAEGTAGAFEVLEVRAESASQTLGLVTERATAVLDAAKAQGVPDADLQTHGLALRPQMDREGRRVIGYVASYALALRLRDIATAPRWSTPQQSGRGRAASRRVPPVHLGDRRARAEAAAHAVEDARRRAESMAKAAGVRVGRVVAIAEAGTATPCPVPGVHRVVAGAASPGAAVPMETGSTELTARVTVRCEIID